MLKGALMMNAELTTKVERLKENLKMSKAMLNVLSKEAEDYMVVTLDLTRICKQGDSLQNPRPWSTRTF